MSCDNSGRLWTYILLITVLVSTTQCSNKFKIAKSDLVAPYDAQQISLIQDHWKQFFKEDIYAAIDPGEVVYSLPFDSYGALYPDYALLREFDEENFEAGLPDRKDKIRNIATIRHSDNDLNKYSMFRIFQWEGNAVKLETAINALSNAEDQQFYREMLDQYSLAPGYQGRNMKRRSVEYNRYLDGFYDKWNAYHLKKTSQGLVHAIEEEKPDYILFFIHGYNVPYSLAVMQSIEVRNYIRRVNENIGKPGKVLMVPVFWTSNDQKRSELDKEEKVKMGDEVKVSNAMKWGFYSTRANFAGLGFRQVLVELESSGIELPEMLIFSHSLGTVVATNAVINATTRLPGSYDKMIENDQCGDVVIYDSFVEEIEKKENVNYKLYRKFDSIPLPKSRFRVFLSAPAISGVETFQDMCDDTKHSTAFFSTVNSKDLTLRKFVGIVNGYGCTSLGLNFECDVMQTKIDYFWDAGYLYYNKEAIDIHQHNIFDYLQQPAYQALVKDYLSFEFPVEK